MGRAVDLHESASSVGVNFSGGALRKCSDEIVKSDCFNAATS